MYTWIRTVLGALPLFAFVILAAGSCRENVVVKSKEKPESVQKIALPANAIPFELIKNRIIVNVKINDSIEAPFTFDTGCTPRLYCSTNFFKKHFVSDLKNAKEERAGFASIPSTTSRNLKENITINLPNYSKTFKEIMLLSDSSWILDSAYVGILNLLPFKGQGLKAQYIGKRFFSLNFEHDYILFSDSDLHLPDTIKTSEKYACDFEVMKSSLLQLHAPMQMIIAGDTVVNKKKFSTFDTGNPYFFSFSEFNIKRSIPRSCADLYIFEYAFSPDKVIQISRVNIQELTLLNQQFKHVLADVRARGYLYGDDYIGLMGVRVIKHFNWTFDFEKNKVYVIPHSRYFDKELNDEIINRLKNIDFTKVKNYVVPPYRYFKKKDIDIYKWTTKDDKVNLLLLKSTVRKSGLRLRDSIVEVNDRAFWSFSEEEKKEMFLRPDGLSIKVQRKGQKGIMEISVQATESRLGHKN